MMNTTRQSIKLIENDKGIYVPINDYYQSTLNYEDYLLEQDKIQKEYYEKN